MAAPTPMMAAVGCTAAPPVFELLVAVPASVAFDEALVTTLPAALEAFAMLVATPGATPPFVPVTVPSALLAALLPVLMAEPTAWLIDAWAAVFVWRELRAAVTAELVARALKELWSAVLVVISETTDPKDPLRPIEARSVGTEPSTAAELVASATAWEIWNIIN